MALKVTIVGALGKMGKRITQLCLEDKEVEIVGLIERPGHDEIGKQVGTATVTDDLSKVVDKTDVVVDFSSPQATQECVRLCSGASKPLVIGTTGHDEGQLERIKRASEHIPIVLSPNMSVGVNILFKIVENVMEVLKDRDYDIEVIEAHHNKKKDAPSGTAKKIAQIIKKFRPDCKFIFSREGFLGERDKREVGIFAIRAGDIVGEHTVMFSTYGERIELKHIATSRDTFAKGAVLAAKWIVGKPAGLYTMFDVLGL